MTKYIDDFAVTNALDSVVADRGSDYVYEAPRVGVATPSCSNVSHDASGELVGPGCLVGTVLFELGAPLDVLSGYDGGAYDTLNGLKGEGHLEVSNAAAIALNVIQTYQDSGSTWGECVTIFHRVLTSVKDAENYL